MNCLSRLSRHPRSALNAVRTTVSLHHFADAAALAAYGFSAKKDLLAELPAVLDRASNCHNPVGVDDDFDPCSQGGSVRAGRANLATAGLNDIAPLGQTRWPSPRSGVPENHPDAKKLVTEDCIQPAEGNA